MQIKEILNYLPQRYPFLLVDKVLDIEPGKSIKALKNVSMNEPFFQGHFPNEPVMPGVLILEALAQASGILAISTHSPEKGIEGSLVYFAGIDNARFRRIVIPGDQLILQTEITKVRREIWKFEAKAFVDGELACSANLMAAKRDK